ncbi:hypothetical protein D0C16_17135 [Cellvibrio sp. KY-GH-1]|nr:hypothetical protein D0C16_17135 [Cellvibrio sp. KY-GH-1]
MREAEIKRALSNHLSPPGVPYFLEEVELNGGQYRADLVDVSDMHCYEIKSAGDNLARLMQQGNGYSRVFDKITLVAAERHLKKALPILPSWWGVIAVLENENEPFKIVRSAKANKYHEPFYLVTLLKKDECLSILEKIGSSKGWKSKSLYLLHEHLANALPLKTLKIFVQECLLQRVSFINLNS